LLGAALMAGLAGCAVKSSGASENQGQPRIVSTSVALCQVLAELDLDLVGVPNSSFELPERYRDVTRVGLPMSPDLEILKTLKPTDVISPNSLQYDLKPKYESINVPCTFVNLMSVEGMFKSIEGLGKKYGRTEQADALIADHRSFMEDYNARIEGKKRPRVLVLMGIPGAYMVATERSYVGNLVKLAGGINVFQEDKALLNVNTEAIAQTDPDVILRAAHGLPEEVRAMFGKEFRENDIWKHFRAVQEERVYDLDFNIFNMSASLDYQEGLDELYTMLYDQE
jgi:iron complex transport system substrate-binding protein